MDVALLLDQRLRPVAVMYVPVDDEDAFEVMPVSRVMRCDRDVSEQAEAHRAIAQRVVARRAHGAERAKGSALDRHIHGVQHASGARRGGVPGALARHRVWIELSASRLREIADRADVPDVMRERELFIGRVTSLGMMQRLEQVGIVAQRLRDRAKPADVFGMAPPRVVTTAVGVGDERRLGQDDVNGRPACA
jgi:hypothetical protein